MTDDNGPPRRPARRTRTTPKAKSPEPAPEFPILPVGAGRQILPLPSGDRADLIEISAESAVAIFNRMPAAERRRNRQRAKFLAAESRAAARDDENSAKTSATVGGAVGGGVFTSSLVAVATSPISVPLLLIMATGIVVLALGLIGAYLLSRAHSRHLRRAELFDALAQEIAQ